MTSKTGIILCLTFLKIIFQVRCYIESPAEDTYGIIGTESAIRNTVNNLFTTLKIKEVQQGHKLKQYSTVHNFFVSVTLQDHDNLKEIARLTKVDNIDNGTQVFITQLNEVLKYNKDNKSDDESDAVYVTNLIEKFLSSLDRLKERNGLQNTTKFYDINKAIIKHFSKVENEFENVTSLTADIYSNKTLLDPNVYWKPSVVSRRIYGGESVKIETFPFMASVQFFKKFQCGGSIIKSDLVITSASCLQLAWNNRYFRENPAFLSVQVGSTFYDYGGENIPVMEIYFYPNYNPKNLRHNLAIMRLMRTLSFGKEFKRIKKIDFDRTPLPMPSNADGITVVGWGAQSMANINENARKNRLSFSVLDFYPLEECQEIYSKEYVTNRNFCAGFFSKGGGACNKDAGGPGVSKGILVGIISFGSPICGARDAPTVFTKLGFYTDWIEEIIEMKTAQEIVQTTKLQRGIPTMNLPPTFFFEAATQKITPIQIPDSSDEEPFTVSPIPIRDGLRNRDKSDPFKGFISSIFNSNEKLKNNKEEMKIDSKKIAKKSEPNKVLRNNGKKKPRTKNKLKKSKHHKRMKKRAITTTQTYDSSDDYTEEEEEEVTNMIDDNHDHGKKQTSSITQEMKNAIQRLAENENINDVTESEDISPEKKDRKNLKRIVQTNPALLTSKLYLAEIVKKEIGKENTKNKRSEKVESYSYESDESSYSDDSYDDSPLRIESDNNDEKLGSKNNSYDETEDVTDYDSYTDEDDEATSKSSKKTNRNSTKKLLKMLAETDNIYDLLSGT